MAPMERLKCNGCWAELEAKGQAVATACSHLFCLNCAHAVIEGDSACPICQEVVTKNNVKVIKVAQDASSCKLSLCGQSPDVIFASALAAVQFWQHQKGLQGQVKEAQLGRRMDKMQEACKKKLAEVYNGYQQAKRKYEEMATARSAMEQDNAELQQKYTQKATQARKLQEMFQALQQENDNLRRSARSGGPPGAFGGGGNSGQHQLAKFSPNLGGMGGAQTFTTVQRTRVFGHLPDLSPTHGAPPALGAPGSGGTPTLLRPGSSGYQHGPHIHSSAIQHLASAAAAGGGVRGLGQGSGGQGGYLGSGRLDASPPFLPSVNAFGQNKRQSLAGGAGGLGGGGGGIFRGGGLGQGGGPPFSR